jgi:hypothetical protein
VERRCISTAFDGELEIWYDDLLCGGGWYDNLLCGGEIWDDDLLGSGVWDDDLLGGGEIWDRSLLCGGIWYDSLLGSGGGGDAFFFGWRRWFRVDDFVHGSLLVVDDCVQERRRFRIHIRQQL